MDVNPVQWQCMDMTNTTTKRTEWVKSADVRVGDVMEFLGRERRVTAIYPYTGPLSDIISHLVDWDIGGGISLERDGDIEILERV